MPLLSMATCKQERIKNIPPTPILFNVSPSAMDSLAIVVASVGLVSTCGKLSGHISWLTNKVGNLDTLTAFRNEIDSLSRVFGSISTCFENPSQATIVLAPHTGYETEHWRNVERSMGDCKKLLDKLYRILQLLSNIKREQTSPRKRANGDTHEHEIRELPLLKQQIIAYRMTMELSLRLIDVYLTLHIIRALINEC